MKVSIECTYCGYKWEETIYNRASLEDKVCPNGNCKDRNLKVKDATSKVDYYKGCPPFPIVFDDRGWPYNMGGTE